MQVDLVQVSNQSSQFVFLQNTKSQDSTMVISMPLSFLPYKEVQ